MPCSATHEAVTTPRHQHTPGTGKATSCLQLGWQLRGGKSPPRASASPKAAATAAEPGASLESGGQEGPRDWRRGQGTWEDASRPAATQTPRERVEPPVPLEGRRRRSGSQCWEMVEIPGKATRSGRAEFEISLSPGYGAATAGAMSPPSDPAGTSRGREAAGGFLWDSGSAGEPNGPNSFAAPRAQLGSGSREVSSAPSAAEASVAAGSWAMGAKTAEEPGEQERPLPNILFTKKAAFGVFFLIFL